MTADASINLKEPLFPHTALKDRRQHKKADADEKRRFFRI
jgi:hypothetical protein